MHENEWQCEMIPQMPQYNTSTENSSWLEKYKAEDAPITFGRFPKQFESDFWGNLDRRFAGILASSLLMNLLLVVYFLNNPLVRETEKHAAAVQERFARLVLDKSPAESEIPPAGNVELSGPGEQAVREKTSASSASTKKSGSTSSGRSSGADQSESSGQAAGPGRLGGSPSRGNVDVGRAGILGLLSSSSEMASGEGVDDILGAGNTVSDMDKALSAGLSRAGAGGSREQLQGKIGAGTGSGALRGGRETGGGNIDTMVEGLGEGKSKGVARSGNIEFQESAPLIEVDEGGGSGGRSQDAVAAIVARHTAAIQSCYQSEVRRTPELKGKIVVRFVITPQGTVESATVVSSTLNNPRVEKCVISRILRWDDFGAVAPDKGTTTIRQVYTFGY